MKKILSILFIYLNFYSLAQPTLIKAKQLGDGLGTGSFVVTGGANGSMTYAAQSSILAPYATTASLSSYVPTSSLALFVPKTFTADVDVQGGYQLALGTTTNPLSQIHNHLTNYVNYEVGTNGCQLDLTTNTGLFAVSSDGANYVYSQMTTAGQTVSDASINNRFVIRDDIASKGLVGYSDYSANVTNNSYVQKSWVTSQGYITSSALSPYVPYVGANSFTTTNNITAQSFISTSTNTANALYVTTTETVNGAWLANLTATVTGNTKLTGTVQANGTVNIGPGTFGTDNLHQLRVTKGTGTVDIGEYISGRGAIWINQTPSTTNWALADLGVAGTGINGSSQIRIMIGGSIYFTYSSNLLDLGSGQTGPINISATSTNGTKIATATSQKIGFWNATPIVQPTTAFGSATFVANSGTAINDASTFDGYTLKQVVSALRAMGLLQ